MYALARILRNTDLKNSKYYSLLMLGSSHARFAPEIQQSNSHHYVNIHRYWLDWLALRDILKTACNITNATYKRVGGLTVPVDTGDQVMCTVGHTDGHNNPDYSTSRAEIQWDRIGPQATLSMPIKGLTGPIMVLCDFTGSTTNHL